VINRAIAAVRSIWGEMPPNLRGAFWILIAAGLLTVMGAMVKHLGKEIPPIQIVFFRSLVTIAVVMPIVVRSGWAGFHTKRPGMHLFRGLMGTLGMVCVFYAFANLPLAETIAIVFSRPLFAVWLAILFLGETVGWRRITAALVGFAGVLVMVRPGSAAFDPASLYAVTAAVTAGSIAVIIKKMSATESTSSIILWFSVTSAVLTAIPAIAVWVPATPVQWGHMILIGIVGSTGMVALTKGFSTGETSFVTGTGLLHLRGNARCLVGGGGADHRLQRLLHRPARTGSDSSPAARAARRRDGAGKRGTVIPVPLRGIWDQ
jgi:drug/metabolite transporter (DMT)-like permease